MEAVNYLIVEVEEAYINEVEISTGDSVIINSTIEEVGHISRVATVIAAPTFTILQAGDKVIIHHNILRLRNDVKGNTVQSDFHIEGNKYFVPLTEIFMFKHGSEWEALDPYCFVKPLSIEEEEGFNLSLPEGSYKGKQEQVGIMVYPNKNLSTQGVKRGDKVKFTKNSEYEFNIDGVLYYKMSTRDIVAVV